MVRNEQNRQVSNFHAHARPGAEYLNTQKHNLITATRTGSSGVTSSAQLFEIVVISMVATEKKKWKKMNPL